MSSGRLFTLAVSALAVLSLSGGSALAQTMVASISAAGPRTVAVVSGELPGAFAATDTHAAWIDYMGCKKHIRRVHVLSFRRLRPNTLRIRLCQGENYGPLSLDHGRAVWVSWLAGNTEYVGRVSVAGPGDRVATTLKKFDFERGNGAEPWVALASDTAGTVIGFAGPVLHVVGNRTHLLFAGSSSSSVDVSGNRVGVVRPEIPEDVYPRIAPQAELHARKTGALLAEFAMPREAEIAVSTNTIAVWTYGRDTVVLDCYDKTGRKFASKNLGSRFPLDPADAVGIIGSRVVYARAQRRIYAWNPRTGAERLLAVSKRTILNLVVTEHAAVWTESVDPRHFAIVRFAVPGR